VNTKTTQGYRHPVRPSLPYAIEAWDRLLEREPRLDFDPLYCHCDHMPDRKEERLQIRVNPAEKRLLEQAAQSAHLSVSAFVLQAASQQAEELLAERQTIILTPEAAAAFAQALAKPAAVNERLRAALRRPRKFRWID
jgi:uncharacterized protein (DUF1778 family)